MQKLGEAIPFYDGKYAIRQGHVPDIDWNAFALGTPYHFIDKEGVSIDKLRRSELYLMFLQNTLPILNKIT